jgi:hypothetical protein
MDEHLEELGFDEDVGARKRARSLSQARGRSRERRADKMEGVEAGESMDVDDGSRVKKKARAESKERSQSRARSQVLLPMSCTMVSRFAPLVIPSLFEHFVFLVLSVLCAVAYSGRVSSSIVFATTVAVR